MRTTRAVAVTAVMVVAAMNFLAACTPEDDSDSIPTPTPVPEPTPEPEIHCQIVWTSQNADEPSLVDVFVLDAPEGAWVGGTGAFGTFTGFYQEAIDVAGNHVDVTPVEGAGAVTNTSETFNLTLTFNGTSDGADVSVSNTDVATIYAVGTDGSVTSTEIGFVGDPMDFTGVWSSRDVDADPDLGTGDVAVVIGTAGAPAVSLGGFGSFAVCYDAAAH